MKKCIGKYCLKFIVRNAILISFVSIPVTLLIFVVCCIYNTLNEHILELFFPIGIGVVIFLLSNLFLINFCNIIYKQEQKYSMIFNDKNAEKLCALIYLSDEWLIDCGTKAVLRKSIKGIDYKHERSLRGGVAIKVTLITDDMAYNINVFDKNDIEKLRLWYTYSNHKL